MMRWNNDWRMVNDDVEPYVSQDRGQISLKKREEMINKVNRHDVLCCSKYAKGLLVGNITKS